MLPLWWPRSACVYCGSRLYTDRHVTTGSVLLHRSHDPRWLACDRHAPLVPLDPLLTAVRAARARGTTDSARGILRGPV